MEKDAASKLSNDSNEFNKKEVKISLVFSHHKNIQYSILAFFTPYNIQQVLKVGENVYVAIGYGLANSIMLEVTIIVGVVVIITILIIIKTIIIYDRGEGRRRSGHHRYS